VSERAIRWLPIYNAASTTIPGYGLCVLQEVGEPDSATQPTIAKQGLTHFKVAQPDAAAENLQDFSRLIVNGPVPLAAGGYGRGTQDWPTKVYWDGTNTGVGDDYGPGSGTWSIRRGTAFRSLGVDPNYTPATGAKRLIWITPSPTSLFQWGKLDEDLGQGETKTMSVWSDNPLAVQAQNVEVTDWLMASGKEIVTGAKLGCINVNGQWIPIVSDTCPTTA
jgi:hypothetical protein